MISEVLPDHHHRLWITTGARTLHVQVFPQRGPDCLLALHMAQVFKAVRVVEDGQAIQWPGGFRLPLLLLAARRSTRWLTHLGDVPCAERYRPLLPLLRYSTPGAALRDQPARHHVMQMFGLRPGELDTILRAYQAPENVMLHRLQDIGLYLRHHLYAEMPVGLLRRPWPYAAHRHPSHHIHTMHDCFIWGRLDLVEDPIWALARASAG